MDGGTENPNANSEGDVIACCQSSSALVVFVQHFHLIDDPVQKCPPRIATALCSGPPLASGCLGSNTSSHRRLVHPPSPSQDAMVVVDPRRRRPPPLCVRRPVCAVPLLCDSRARAPEEEARRWRRPTAQGREGARSAPPRDRARPSRDIARRGLRTKVCCLLRTALPSPLRGGGERRRLSARCCARDARSCQCSLRAQARNRPEFGRAKPQIC